MSCEEDASVLLLIPSSGGSVLLSGFFLARCGWMGEYTYIIMIWYKMVGGGHRLIPFSFGCCAGHGVVDEVNAVTRIFYHFYLTPPYDGHIIAINLFILFFCHPLKKKKMEKGKDISAGGQC